MYILCVLVYPGPQPHNVSVVSVNGTSVMIVSTISPQLQFASIITEWKVTLQRPGSAKTFQTTPFTLPSAQLMVTNLLPVTEYSVWVSVRAGSAEGQPSSAAVRGETGEDGSVLYSREDPLH